ncbi:ependymin-like [Diretmus argenteus]
MRAFVVLLSFLASSCLAQKPHPCTTPPLLTGALTVSTQNEKLWAYAKYQYDALGQRIRFKEMGTYQNKSFTLDALLLYREVTTTAVMYEIDEKEKKCRKTAFKTDFQPWAVPKDATLLGQAILGSSSGPGMGLLVNTWWGKLPNNTGQYMSTVTEFGCIPVTTMYQTDQYGWVMTSFFDNIIGLTDPQELNPPDFCTQAEVEAGMKEEPADFFSLFINKH